jgi:hypothetical protein
MDTGRFRTKVGDHGFYTAAQVVDVRFVGTKVEPSPLGTVNGGREIGHHPRPEQFVSK